MKVWPAALALAALFGCGGNSATTPDSGGAPDLARVACGDSAYFTACVHSCGETTETESVFARCVDGVYQCDPPLVPAISCGAAAWSARLSCGPWVEGYDCGVECAVCDPDRGWGCKPCPDAAASDAG